MNISDYAQLRTFKKNAQLSVFRSTMYILFEFYCPSIGNYFCGILHYR
ncbi:hypothetical protein TREAZ_0876 [Leadbettera azotonutricia ZAS-9]|uniref:Uncharacterized protein n=1 Tax=Leadbettera azotonutricia (strain ATCC BAA-888 / DSM 13862 / ZAS-9) TaxID=545695 RepID=F5Y906_LEAAZ|nr:hypothetical protein TREAZ_0876 [Leadbettera azotonutricia ZAS-9]